MKKLMSVVLPVKTFAASIFAGLCCLYMAGGTLYNLIYRDPNFRYTIPFIFLLEGIVLSILIAALWGVFFGGAVLRKWRWFPRLCLFALSLLVLLALCLLVFFAVPTDEAKLWLFAALCVAAGVGVLAILAELVFRRTGKRYTEILRRYQGKAE